MDRINGKGHKARKFDFGDDEALSQDEVATQITAVWLNGVQEELVNVITSQGIKLNIKKNDQLKAAIENIVANKAVELDLSLKKMLDHDFEAHKTSIAQLINRLATMTVTQENYSKELTELHKNIDGINSKVAAEAEDAKSLRVQLTGMASELQRTVVDVVKKVEPIERSIYDHEVRITNLETKPHPFPKPHEI